MLRNGDGTLYRGESIAEIMHERFDTVPYPYLSDVLGSDWGMDAPTTPAEFQEYAFAVARRIYEDEAGHLYPCKA